MAEATAVRSRTSLASLPPALLAGVLQHVPLQQRLGSCARSCSSLRRAAAAATSSIKQRERSAAQLDALAVWLDTHGKHVTSLELSGQSPPKHDVSRLLTACPGLAELQLESVSINLAALGPAGDQISSSSAMAQLTSLSLSFSAVSGLHRLAAATALRRLKLYNCRCADELPGEALDGLRQLTSLELSPWDSGDPLVAALGQLSRLSGLQRLSAFGTNEALAAALPQLQHLSQLTELDLHGSSGLLDLSTAALGRLSTALQRLSLYSSAGFDPAAMAGLQQLRRLAVENTAYSTQATAASFAAVTASSQLTSLACGVAGWPHMFQPARPLPQLQQLAVSRPWSWAGSAAAAEHAASAQLATADLAAMAGCCTGLRELALDHRAHHTGLRLTPLAQLASLTKLRVWSPRKAMIGDLAQLTQLLDLDLSDCSSLNYRDCEPLTSLRRLTRLELINLDGWLLSIGLIYCLGFRVWDPEDWGLDDLDDGHGTDVWLQLLASLDEIDADGGALGHHRKVMRSIGEEPFY